MGGKPRAGVPERSKGQGLGPCGEGLRRFKSCPPHSFSLRKGPLAVPLWMPQRFESRNYEYRKNVRESGPQRRSRGLFQRGLIYKIACWTHQERVPASAGHPSKTNNPVGGYDNEGNTTVQELRSGLWRRRERTLRARPIHRCRALLRQGHHPGLNEAAPGRRAQNLSFALCPPLWGGRFFPSCPADALSLGLVEQPLLVRAALGPALQARAQVHEDCGHQHEEEGGPEAPVHLSGHGHAHGQVPLEDDRRTSPKWLACGVPGPFLSAGRRVRRDKRRQQDNEDNRSNCRKDRVDTAPEERDRPHLLGRRTQELPPLEGDGDQEEKPDGEAHGRGRDAQHGLEFRVHEKAVQAVELKYRGWGIESPS